MNNIITINNRTIKKILFGDLVKYNILIPNEQRIIDKIKVNNIVLYQLNYLKDNGTMNFLGVINLHKYVNQYYLVDGHHRYQACKKLYNEHSHNVSIVVEIVDVKTKEELKDNYTLINKNTPLPEFPDDIDKNIPELSAKYFMDKYPDIWSPSMRCKRPYINFNQFQETLGYLTKKIPAITSSTDLINKVVEYNKTISKWNIKHFNKVNETMYNKAKENEFYLGLFNYINNQDYGYEWAKKLVEHETGEKIIPIKLTKTRKAVPKKVKNDSWDLYVGPLHGSAYCLVCTTTEINSKNFEAGHIISDKNGGESIVNNIVPICGQCNKCIGKKNMDEYIKEFHPDNYENFTSKKYKIINMNTNKEIEKKIEKKGLLRLW